MRNAAALAVCAALAVSGGPRAALAAPQDDGHGHAAEISLSDLTAEQRAIAVDAWAHVYCRCERENWSRTLANCPDGCAVPQKQQVLQRIQDGWTITQIVKEQVRLYGPKAAADPGTTSNGTLLVLAGLFAGAGAAGLVLAAWRRSAEERKSAAAAARAARPVASAETDAVERELKEID